MQEHPAYQIKLRRWNVPKEELLDDLRRVAAELGVRTLTKKAYRTRGQFYPGTLRVRFGTWTAALFAAGLERSVQRNIPESELMENLAELWLKVGRQPTSNDLRGNVSRFSAHPYKRRFGSFIEALVAFAGWAGVELPANAKSIRDSRTDRPRSPRDPSWRQRAQVLMRDGATCRLCGARPEHGARLVVDHVVPWSKGGETVLENLQILCQQCNGGKGDTAPEEARSTNDEGSPKA